MSSFNSQPSWAIRRAVSRGFTLVEVLVVLLILVILASIALPITKQLIADSRVSRTARSITSYFDTARNRAIAEGRQVGVLLRRLDDVTPFGRSQAVRVNMLVGAPPYSGDSSNSVAVLQPTSTSVVTAHFTPSNNQLMALAASMVANPAVTGDSDDLRAPIRNRDYLELPGGRTVPFTITYRALTQPDTVPVEITFSLDEGVGGTSTFPAPPSHIAVARPVRYRIHRRPTISSASPFDLPRGLAIDLNYSGTGPTGNEFAPSSNTASPAYNIAIVFGSDGKVVSVAQSNDGIGRPPLGQIFFCLGTTDGIRPDSLFSQEKKAVANLLNPESIWIVVNQSTGRVSSAPFSSVSTIPSVVVTDPTAGVLDVALAEARFLANLSDTVDLE